VWRVSIDMAVDFCLEAVEEAIARHGKPDIFDTDQEASSPAWPSPACWPTTASPSAWWRVEDVSRRRDTGFDLIAYSDHLGRRRSHYIQIKATSRSVAPPLIREVVGCNRNMKTGDEFWLVALTFTTQAMYLGGRRTMCACSGLMSCSVTAASAPSATTAQS
jgi:hypothetical protein